MRATKKSSYPIAAGVMTLIAASLCSLFTLVFSAGISSVGQRAAIYSFAYAIMGVSGTYGFVLGLIAGIFTLRRRNLPLVIVGDYALLIAYATIGLEPYAGIDSKVGVMIGPFVLVALSLIFVMKSRREFA